MKHPFPFFLLLGGMLSLSSCADSLVRVKPYERGNLARPIMAESMDPLQTAMTEHAYFSREAGFGGGGVGGGGCGCNYQYFFSSCASPLPPSLPAKS